jgi:hypothetical protein
LYFTFSDGIPVGGRALALAHLDGQNALAPTGGDGAELVEFGRNAGFDVAAVLGKGRSVVLQRGADASGDVFGEIRAQVEQLPLAADDLVDRRQFVGGLEQSRAQLGQAGERATKNDQIPRRGHAQACPRGQSLQVAEFAQDLANRFAHGLLNHQPLDRILAAADLGDIDQGKEQPLAHETAAHGRDRDVEQIQQGSLPPPVDHGLDQFQVRAGLFVDDEEVVALK